MTSIDLNADLGEDPQALDRDAQLMCFISSCNIACGGHAGDGISMTAMVAAAKKAGIAAGAHPSYPDRSNFGRKSMDIDIADLIDSLLSQVKNLQTIANNANVKLHHIKPHGALYNDLADDAALASAVARALISAFPDMALMGLANGACETAVLACGHHFIAEAFIDRAYNAHGRLVPRSQNGAVLAEDDDRIAQAVMIAKTHKVRTLTGEVLEIRADSLCIHSDSPGALATAQKTRTALEAAGLTVGCTI